MFVGITTGSTTTTRDLFCQIVGLEIIAIESLVCMRAPCVKIINFVINGSWVLIGGIGATRPTFLGHNNALPSECNFEIHSCGLCSARHAHSIYFLRRPAPIWKDISTNIIVPSMSKGLVWFMLFFLAGSQPFAVPPHQSPWRCAVVTGTETASLIAAISATIRCCRSTFALPLESYISSLSLSS